MESETADSLHTAGVWWNGYVPTIFIHRSNSQHRELSLQKKSPPLLLPGIEPETFWSRVRRSTTELCFPCYNGSKQTLRDCPVSESLESTGTCNSGLFFSFFGVALASRLCNQDVSEQLFFYVALVSRLCNQRDYRLKNPWCNQDVSKQLKKKIVALASRLFNQDVSEQLPTFTQSSAY